MLRLDLSSEPRWYDLGHDVRVFAAPLTSAILLSLKTEPMLEGGEKLPADEQSLLFAKAVAARVIRDWEGVGDGDGNPLPVSPAAAAALMDLFPMYSAFEATYIVPWLKLDAEKNASAPLPNGTSAGAPATAKRARKLAPPVPRR